MSGPATQVLAGRFELGPWIGEGSLSVVHEAIDRMTGRRVAIKLAGGALDDAAAARRRFEREAAALAVISSPHVVELISAGTTDDGRPFLALERLVGQTLEALVAERALEIAEVVRAIGEAAAALELAHGVGTVHRDLKPANLFRHEGDGRRVVKVLDFGMVVDTAGPTDRMRDAFGGTPFYMAPEQVRGQLSRIGPATDVWALAIVTLTLLTGEVYWASSSADEVMREIEAGVAERPSSRWRWLPEAFDAWFLRATQRVPERRFRSVAIQAAQLAAALAGVRAPDNRGAGSMMAAPTLVAARTPTPSLVRLSGQPLPVIGRELDQRAVAGLLAPGAIVTLTGPAGIGKSRLARAACDAASDRFVDGGWFVTVPHDADEGAVTTAIAGALGLAPDSTREPAEHVIESLAPRRVLVVLDGVERVAATAVALERLRARCPAVAWLVTSRVPLGVAGERCHGIEPLEVPRAAAVGSGGGDAGPAPAVGAGEAATFSAIELFVRCAREAVPHFLLTDGNVADVVAICRAVEGFPLAIELAAARVLTSSPAEIRATLEGEPAQASSVRHAVVWSYRLLAPDQRRMLRQLALLPAGLTFEQCKRVLAGHGDDPVYAVLRLVQTHLVAWNGDAPRRLVMLDTVRELCRERSRARGEDAALWRVAHAHALEVAAGGAAGVASDAWLAQVDAEHDNLRAVLTHLLDAAPADAMGLAGRLAYYWYLRGDYHEGARWLEDSIARSGASDGAALVRALHGAGRLALLTCHYEKAAAWLARARGLAAAMRDDRGQAAAEQLLGSVARERGDRAGAAAYHGRALAVWERLGDVREAARARNYLVFAAWLGDAAGDPGAVERAWWEHGASEAAALGDPEVSVWLHLNRGAIEHHAGDHGAARRTLGRAFAEAVSARFHEGIAWALELLGRASHARGEHLQARAQLAAALRVHRRLGDRWRCASVLEALAAVAVTTDRPARAAVYLGAADAIRRQIDAPVPACERAAVAAVAARGHDLLGDAFATGCERGRRASLDHTIELARDVS